MYDLMPPNMKAQFNLINKPNQSIKLIVYLNSKTSWVKISSGVDVATDPEGENYSSELAKNNVIAGGVLNSKQQITNNRSQITTKK